MRGISLRKCCEPDSNMFFLNEHRNLIFAFSEEDVIEVCSQGHCGSVRGCSCAVPKVSQMILSTWNAISSFQGVCITPFIHVHNDPDQNMWVVRSRSGTGSALVGFCLRQSKVLENWSICVCLEQSWSTACGFLSTAETQPCWYSIQ